MTLTKGQMSRFQELAGTMKKRGFQEPRAEVLPGKAGAVVLLLSGMKGGRKLEASMEVATPELFAVALVQLQSMVKAQRRAS